MSPWRATGRAAVRAVAILAHATFVAPVSAAELHLVPPLPCPDAGEISYLVERALGRPIASVPGGASYSITMQRNGKAFVARLEGRAAHGAEDAGGALRERSFSATSCGELIDTLALAVALALGAGLSDRSASSTDEPPVPPAPELPERTADVPVESSTPSPAPRFAALAWAVGDSGTLPSAALGIGVGLGVRWTAVELRAAGLLLPAQHGSVGGLPDATAGADIGLLSGSALACSPLSLRTAALELGVCGGWELGRLRATGTGVLRPYRKSTLWSAPRADAMLRWTPAASALSLDVLLTVAAPLQRDEFILKDIGSVHRLPNVVARAGLGLGWVIW